MQLFPNAKQYLNPYPFFKKMRVESPVAYDESQKIWGVYGYEDVQRIITDHHIFSSDFSQSDEAQLQSRPKTLLTSDPPLHKNLRRLVSKAFSPKAIQDMEPRITHIVKDLLHHIQDKNQIELIQDFAAPLPTIVIAEMLGIPIEDRDVFKRWADQLLNTEVDFAANQKSDRQVVLEEMNQYFRHIIEQRRANTGTDLISSLILAEIEGERLEEEELLSFCELLLLAGHITTVHLIGNALWSLMEHPNKMEQLRSNRVLLPLTIEEVLRYKSPIQVVARVAKHDVKIGEQTIRKGERILAWIGSANHDEHQFEQADQFCIHRSPNPHVAFGHGIHFCLGAPLARLEARIGIQSLLDTFSHMQLNPSIPLESTGSFFIYGLHTLHLEVKR